MMTNDERKTLNEIHGSVQVLVSQNRQHHDNIEQLFERIGSVEVCANVNRKDISWIQALGAAAFGGFSAVIGWIVMKLNGG